METLAACIEQRLQEADNDRMWVYLRSVDQALRMRATLFIRNLFEDFKTLHRNEPEKALRLWRQYTPDGYQHQEIPELTN